MALVVDVFNVDTSIKRTVLHFRAFACVCPELTKPIGRSYARYGVFAYRIFVRPHREEYYLSVCLPAWCASRSSLTSSLKVLGSNTVCSAALLCAFRFVLFVPRPPWLRLIVSLFIINVLHSLYRRSLASLPAFSLRLAARARNTHTRANLPQFKNASLGPHCGLNNDTSPHYLRNQ